MNSIKNILTILALIIALVIVASVFLYLESEKQGSLQDELLTGERYREIDGSGGFVNTNGNPITIGEHLGKGIILIEFMSYSCVNCQRAFPHLTEWYEKYSDEGLIVIGIHTPEFAFEHELKNVEAAMQKSGIEFPVVLDNEYTTWNSYSNHYWPRTLLINRDGAIVYDHIGVGDFEDIEDEIKNQLK